MTLVWLDYALLAVILLSTLISLFRGFVKEVMSLLGWVLAGWTAFRFSNDFALFLQRFISHEGAGYALAFVGLFIGVLILSVLVNRLITKLIHLGGLKTIDRVLGCLFGALRGALVVTVLVLLGGISPLAADAVWSDSFMIEYFGEVSTWLSENIAERVEPSITTQEIDL